MARKFGCRNPENGVAGSVYVLEKCCNRTVLLTELVLSGATEVLAREGTCEESESRTKRL